jgi:4-aminobutyrate aminotransferase / (S)-3-amino-2-methylpropionate transaminase / 5-aminovalerate transaminase
MNATLTEQKTINLKTSIPGPKSQEMLKRRANAAPTGLGKSTEVVVADAKGAVVTDVDGNTLLDFAGAIGVMNIGHCAPNVVKAIQQQAEKYVHTCALVTTFEPMVELCELMNKITPGTHAKKTLLANSGSEAVENAVNISRYYTKRRGVICFEGGYHGRTLLTLSLTSKHGLFKKGFGPFGGDIYRLPAPNVYRKPDQMTEEEYIDFCIKNLRTALISQVDVSDLAAILIEPVQGEAGFIPIPKAFLQEIRNICNESGAVMIADEIQCGFGRTGKLFACEHHGIVPDMMTTAKSMGAGLPISATVGKAEIMDAVHLGGVGGTYSGSPIACVAAIEVIKEMTKPAFMKQAEHCGKILGTRLAAMKEKYSIIGDVRGLGAMRLVEFVKDRKTKTPDPDLTLKIIKDAVSNGIILIRAGLFTNCIRLMPPLVITDEQLHEGLDVLEGAIGRGMKGI